MQILIFKTNLTSSTHIGIVGQCLNNNPDIFKWNVDLHDCDKILRIVTNSLTPEEIQNIILKAGYFCEELV